MKDKPKIEYRYEAEFKFAFFPTRLKSRKWVWWVNYISIKRVKKDE